MCTNQFSYLRLCISDWIIITNIILHLFILYLIFDFILFKKIWLLLFLKQTQSNILAFFNKLSKISIILLKELNMEHRYSTKSLRENIITLNLIVYWLIVVNRPWKQQERYTNTSSAHSKLTPSSQPTNLNRTPHRFNDLIKKSNITWIIFQRRDNRTVWVDTIEDTIFNLKTEFYLKSL